MPGFLNFRHCNSPTDLDNNTESDGGIYESMRRDQQKQKPQKLAWAIEEAASSTGLSKAYFRKIIAAGELKTTRAGRRVLIRDCDLKAWLDRNVQEPAL
jgi:excisionase family DNA binding protein